MMISQQLQTSLNLAIQEANKRGHEYVTAEHILYALLYDSQTQKIIEACGGSVDQTRKDLEHYFATKLKSEVMEEGHVSQPTIGFQRILQRAAQHVLSSGQEQIYPDSVLVSIFSEKDSFAAYFLAKQEITRFDLLNFLSHGVRKGDEEKFEDSEESLGGENENLPQLYEEREDTKQDKKNSKTAPSNLALYTENLCEKARQGKFDPLIGRSEEIHRTIQILSRRRKNNALLVGDSGVGKTAIVEGLAQQIVEKKVPSSLAQAEIYALDLASLISGTKFRGDFERRLKSLIKELKKTPNAILFIDEIHTIIGAGAVSGGSLDASNILKPSLSSGNLRCIGSTTYKEFRQYFENDHAMARRFQKISVDEPSIEDTIAILKGLKGCYETFHGVHYTADALKAAAELSDRYIKDRKLPDKAIDLLDEVGAALSLKFKAESPDETKVRPIHKIGAAQVKAVVAKIARIPIDRLTSADKSALENLGDKLRKMVFGQDEAIQSVENAIQLSRSGLASDQKPIGSFLFAGPTGVGKTELAKQLAKTLGIEFIRIDMSEYMERHAVSRLIGAPPGYVGYEEGGILTDRVHQNPHSVVLLDEIEKAHQDVHNILLQIMDYGTLTDSNGRASDCRNIILIMTTNVGGAELTKSSIGFSRDAMDMEKNKAAINQAFSPEFRNRIDAIISFNPLPETVMLSIVDKFLKEIEEKLAAKHCKFEATEKCKKYFAEKGYDPSYGARPLNRLIQDELKKPLAQNLLFGPLSKVSKGGKVIADFEDGKIVLKF